MANNVHLNGRLAPADQAMISVWDAGFLHGASTFTTMLAHRGKVFRFGRHLDRLMDTAEALNLRVLTTPERLTAATYELLAANELAEARIRLTLTPGSIRMITPVPPPAETAAGETAPALPEPTVLITADPVPAYPPQWYEQGIGVVVSSLKQMAGEAVFGQKTGCYLPRILARQEAAAKGAEEALWFTPDNRLAEACFCNVFLLLDGKVCTPPLDTPVLAGVVREAVLELCGRLNIPCDSDATLTVHEMLSAQEMFLTSSTSGIRPVVRVERHAVGDEKPGAVTRRLMAAYRELLDQECA